MAFKFTNTILAWLVGLPPPSHDDAKATIVEADWMMEQITKEGWAKFDAAQRITLQAGVLQQCKEHGCYFDGNKGIEEAYKLGNAQFTAGELKGTFESTQELRDIIKYVIYYNSRSGCEICASFRPYC